MDRIHPLKLETPSTGGTETDNFPTSLNKNEDYIDSRGLVLQNDTSDTETVYLDRDASDNINFYTANTERLRIGSTGELIVNTGVNTYTFPTTRPTDTYILSAVDSSGTLGWVVKPSGYFELNTSTTPDRIVQPTSASYDEDFIIGSTSLDHVATASYYSRMFWDDSLFSLRAGRVTSTQWDTRGQGSIAFGYNCEATQHYSFSTGNASTSKGVGSCSFGVTCNARGQYSLAGGNTAISGNSDNEANSCTISWGHDITISGLASAGFGYNNTFTGDYSIMGGSTNTETGNSTCNVIGGESGTYNNNTYCLLTGQTNEVAVCRYTTVVGSDADVYDCDGSIISGVTNSATNKLSQSHSIMYCENSYILGSTIEAYQADYTTILGYRHGIRSLNYSLVAGQYHFYQANYNRDNSFLLGRYGVVDYISSFTLSPGSGVEGTEPSTSNGDVQTIQVEGFNHNVDIDDSTATNLFPGYLNAGSGNTNYVLIKSNWVVRFKATVIGTVTTTSGSFTIGDTVIYEVDSAVKFDGSTTTTLYSNITTLHEDTNVVGHVFIDVRTTSIGSNRGAYIRALGSSTIAGVNFNWKTSWKIINSTWS